MIKSPVKFNGWCALLLLSMLVLPAGAQTPPPANFERISADLSSQEKEERLSALIAMRGIARELGAGDRDAVAARCGDILRSDPSPVVRAAAAGVLEEIGTPTSSAQIVESLPRQKEVNVRKAIAYALAGHKDTESLDILRTLLRDRKAEVRGAAAWAIAQRNETSLSDDLIRYLRKYRKDEDAFGRSMAVRALGAHPEARDLLLRILSGDKHDIVLISAASALARIAAPGDTEVIEALKVAALSRNPYLASQSNAALDQLRSRP
ncbi:MAG: HEAT repeat domain-containing protein [Blastocatellales bacterium]